MEPRVLRDSSLFSRNTEHFNRFIKGIAISKDAGFSTLLVVESTWPPACYEFKWTSNFSEC